MKIFVPLTDEMLETLDGSETPITYLVGMRLQARDPTPEETQFKVTPLKDALPVDRLPGAPALQPARH